MASPAGAAILVRLARRGPASQPCIVFAVDGVLLLALLERGKIICAVGRCGARHRQWISAGSRRLLISALAAIRLDGNAFDRCGSPGSRADGRYRPCVAGRDGVCGRWPAGSVRFEPELSGRSVTGALVVAA